MQQSSEECSKELPQLALRGVKERESMVQILEHFAFLLIVIVGVLDAANLSLAAAKRTVRSVKEIREELKKF